LPLPQKARHLASRYAARRRLEDYAQLGCHFTDGAAQPNAHIDQRRRVSRQRLGAGYESVLSAYYVEQYNPCIYAAKIRRKDGLCGGCSLSRQNIPPQSIKEK